jgi:hypothetical protein
VDEGCPQEETQAIADGSADEREHAALRRLSFALSARNNAKEATDGTEINTSALVHVALGIDGSGLSDLRGLDRTSYAEAMKDPDDARGKVLSVEGDVIQIQKDKDLFRGTMAAGFGNWVYVITPGRTDGIVADSHVRFAGFFVQKFSYPNTLGGMTESALVVGRFVGQPDTDPPLAGDPPKAPASAPPRGGRLPNRPAGAAPSADAPKWFVTCRCTAGDQACAARCSAAMKRGEPAAPSAAAPSPASLPPAATSRPRAGGCACAAGDTQCAMRCSAGQ